MKIAICDDEKQIIIDYSKIINEYLYENNIVCTVDDFTDGNSFLQLANEYDLVFLDYDLPDINGMEIARNIRENDGRIMIVFLTAYAEHVYDSFEVDAFRYLLKPVSKEKIYETLNKFLNIYNHNRKITIPTNTAHISVDADEVIYIEAAKKHTKVKTTGNEYIANKAISIYQTEIANPHFFRTHRGYIVNMRYISTVEKNTITLTNGEIVLVSSKCRDEFNKSYMNYLKFGS